MISKKEGEGGRKGKEDREGGREEGKKKGRKEAKFNTFLLRKYKDDSLIDKTQVTTSILMKPSDYGHLI